MIQSEYLGRPCKNFSFMSDTYISSDPRDGKEKYVLATGSAHTCNAHIIIIDTEDLTAEDIEIPGDIGVWAMMYLPEYERLLVGTTGFFGYLHALNLRTRTWEESLRLEGQSYIWNLTRGGDGLIYGSNYPGCLLLCYDPKEHKLFSAGRVGNNPDNLYSRLVFTLPSGDILISVGLTERETHLYDVKKKCFTQVFDKGYYADEVTSELVVVSGKGGTYYYDAHTLELLDGPVEKGSLDGIKTSCVKEYLKKRMQSPLADLLPYQGGYYSQVLKDGRIIGEFKQQLFIVKEGQITFYDIPATPPPMKFHSMEVAPDGILWFGAGTLGNNMGWYDPKTGNSWNSHSITKISGEIYGIVPYKDKIYFTCYAGGDHVVYDPKKKWDQFNNMNPRTLRSVALQKMGRPIAGSCMGPDGNIWTGWCGIYGVYGGGVSRINTETLEVDGWFGQVPEQSIGHMAAGNKHMYATSHWMNSGMPYRFDDEFRLLRLDMDCNVVWSETFQPGLFPGCLAVVNGKLFLSLRDRLADTAKLVVYDETTMEKLTTITFGSLGGPGRYEMEKKSIRHLLGYGEKQLVVFIDDRAFLFDTESYEIQQTAELPGMAETCAIGPDRTLYFSIDEKLYRIRFE